MADELASLAALKRYVAQRRADLADKFPKKLDPREYDRHCGRHEELESFAQALQDTIRKANSADGGGDDDDADPA